MTALLIALRREPWLELVGPPSDRIVPVIDRVPFRLRTGRLGHCAYVALDGGVRDPRFAAALVVHDPAGAILDVLPGPVITGAPAFHPSSASLAFVREIAADEREVVELDLTSGEESVHLTADGVRACAWQSDHRLLVSFTDRIETLDRASGDRTTLVQDDVASGFAQWGTDDLYVTLEDVCIDTDGRLAWTRSWHQQGRASRADVLVRDGTDERTIANSRAPRFVDGELAVLQRSSIYWPASGRRVQHVDIEDFDVVRNS
jgi:hypothetical protein